MAGEMADVGRILDHGRHRVERDMARHQHDLGEQRPCRVARQGQAASSAYWSGMPNQPKLGPVIVEIVGPDDAAEAPEIGAGRAASSARLDIEGLPAGLGHDAGPGRPVGRGLQMVEPLVGEPGAGIDRAMGQPGAAAIGRRGDPRAAQVKPASVSLAWKRARAGTARGLSAGSSSNTAP
jgi:hypothetical protein